VGQQRDTHTGGGELLHQLVGALRALVGQHGLQVRLLLQAGQESAETGAQLGSQELDVGVQLTDALPLGELLLKLIHCGYPIVECENLPESV